MSSYNSAGPGDLKQRFIKRVEDQVYEDRATLQELKRCFDGLHLGLFTRDQRDLCVVSNIECGDRDLEFMAILKDIHREVQYSMELKLKFLNFSC
ncbi:hypothetical protein Hanom_Chr05g00444211 [Helianthus anomalus]